MQGQLSSEQIAARIKAAFPEDACSIEHRDHFDKISVRFYAPGRRELFTSDDITVVSVSESSLLELQIEEWKREYKKKSSGESV
jgi:hypothetical protein